jgi:ligand-binding SRPBCC domain-containing protein
MTRLQEITIIVAPLERCFDLARSVEVHLLGNVHFGEQAVPLAGLHGNRVSGLLEMGDTVTWQARHFGVSQKLTSAITEFDPPHAFQDTMLKGAFAWMQHDHFFRSSSDTAAGRVGGAAGARLVYAVAASRAQCGNQAGCGIS